MKGVIAALLLLLTSGCMNLCYVAQQREPHRNSWAVYEPSHSCCQCIGSGVLALFGQTSSVDGVGEAYCAIFLPLLIVDLPCEVVLDTVFLPWDIGWQVVRQDENDK